MRFPINNGRIIRILRTSPVAPDDLGHGLENSLFTSVGRPFSAPLFQHSVENVQCHLYTTYLSRTYTVESNSFFQSFLCHSLLHTVLNDKGLGGNVVRRRNFRKFDQSFVVSKLNKTAKFCTIAMKSRTTSRQNM